jgi:Putative restriction endonuclease
MLDIPLQMGVNAPKEHQRIIARLTARLFNLLENGDIAYEPLPEVMIDESKTSPTPDVLLYDNVGSRNMVIIEIAAAGARKDFEKTATLVEDYDVPEGFVYNYPKKTWRKYKLGVGEVTENPSFCDAIGYDLDHFLQ